MNEILDRIKNHGIAGMGGGGFPAYYKLRSKADTIIANCVECEPLMWSDYHCINKYPDHLINGLKLMQNITGARRVIIALKKKREALADLLVPKLTKGMEIAFLDDYYPAGDEFMIIYDLLGVVVPEGGIPPDIGITVNNAATIVAISLAQENKPSISRFVTVTGAVKKPVTLEVPLGTSFSHLLELAGGSDLREYAILEGGVMMGNNASGDSAVTKTTTGIVILPLDHPAVNEQNTSIDHIYKIARSMCDQCYTCSEVCPRLQIGHSIEPHKIMRRISFMLEESRSATSLSHLCCECGLCSLFACPLGISPRKVIGDLKKKSSRSKDNIKDRDPDPMLNFKRIPSKRLVARLGLEEYDKRENYLLEKSPDPSSVKILTGQHAGAPAVPNVKEGQAVKKGELIGKADETAISLPVHASISGIIEKVNKDYIVITNRKLK